MGRQTSSFAIATGDNLSHVGGHGLRRGWVNDAIAFGALALFVFLKVSTSTS